MICCAVCGSIRVQYAIWYSPNTGETGDCFGSWNAGDNTYCADCDAEGRDGNCDLLDEAVDPETFKKLREEYMLSKRKSVVRHEGVTYMARQEPLKRDGGDPPREWYWTVQDPKHGCCIDERVPGEYFKTLTKARAALGKFLGIQL